MKYRHASPIAELYRQLSNPWMRAKEVVKEMDLSYDQVATFLSHNAHMGFMETRYQRPRTEYRFVGNALEQEPVYTQKLRERRARELSPYLEQLESAGYGKAAQFLRDTYTGGA